ncbi:TPA: ribosome biogenesis GTPase YlqF [Neisseria weaveri]
MAIQWFPGHMNKAKKAIAERIKSIDMVIEMLDARLPASSENPLLAQLSKGKPKLKILNKQDLADPERTAVWLDYYNSRPDTQAIALDSSEQGATAKITRACRNMMPNRGGIDKPLRVLICGIPNVGKSTLINGMIGKKSAKTGNEPGITKAEQRLFLADDFWLYDTPGMLWPKIIVEESGYNLAASGAVGRNALDEEEVALELLDYLRRHYLPLLQARYQADKDPSSHWNDTEWLEWIAKKRGAVLSGGRINYQKAAENTLTDFRDGHIGRITLETPNQWEAWLKTAKQKEAELKAAREARKAERKGQRLSEKD